MDGRIIVVIEQDPSDRNVWRYGRPDENGALPADAARLRADGVGGAAVVDAPTADYSTAVLLVRTAGGRTRLSYDVTGAQFPDHNPSQPPPRPPERPWERSTAGRAKATGKTLREKAERHGPEQPKAAA